MTSYFNRVAVAVSTAGQGTVTFGSALNASFLTPSEAGAVNGDDPYYLIEEGNDFEIGQGTIGGSVTTLARTTVLVSKIGGIVGTDKMNLSGGAVLRFINEAAAEQAKWPNTQDVQSTGIPGVDDGQGMFYKESISSADVEVFRVQRYANYSGGSNSNQRFGLRVISTVGADVDTEEWALFSRLNHSGNYNGVAGYLQARRLDSGAGTTWASVIEARDETEVANPSAGLYGIEVDVVANGTDDSNTRRGIDIIGFRHNSSGDAVEIGVGLRLVTALGDEANVSFNTGILLKGTYNDVGIDMSSATMSTRAIKLASGHKIELGTSRTLFVATGSYVFRDEATPRNFCIIAATGAISVAGASPSFVVSGNQVVGARVAGWTDQTATAARTDLGASPTVGALASFCAAMYADLKTHGLIGN